jgi:hypothetical protein
MKEKKELIKRKKRNKVEDEGTKQRRRKERMEGIRHETKW